jgi:HAD superfamily hydrolase (TIGR01490 family)
LIRRVNDELHAKLQRGLGLFDLDGTLIAWDTQILFCDYVLKQEGIRRAFLLFFAAFTPAAGILGDEGMKRVFLSYLWRVEEEQLAEWVRDWVAEWFPARCYAPLLERLEKHRAAGHLTILASASPEFYATEVGRALGFDLAFGTQVEWTGAFPLLPDLRNHKGAEKVRRLSEIIGAPQDLWPLSHGYSDSSADLPMLERCVTSTLVNPSASLTAIGEERGWEIVRPPLPWKNRSGKVREILRRISGLGGK